MKITRRNAIGILASLSTLIEVLEMCGDQLV
jgi:hypothetical protein